MELKECVYTRRSIRKYKPNPIPHGVLEELMEGAVMAPSGVNLQPWYFVVIETPEEVKKYTELMKNSAENFRRTLELRFPNRPDVVDDTIAFMSTMGGAPVIVLAFFKKESFNELGKASPALQSVAAAIENLLLLAWDKGIGSCWMTGVFKMGVDVVLEHEYAPENGKFLAAIALGYPAQEPTAPTRKGERVKFI